MSNLQIITPSDMHVHLRDPDKFPPRIFEQIVRWTAKRYHYAVVMPNTATPILRVDDMIKYRQQIITASEGYDFTPLMTFMLTGATTPQTVKEFAKIGAVAGKLYPKGVTTNSSNGVSNIKALKDIFATMENEVIILSIHGEMPGADWQRSEIEFLHTLEWLIKTFPDLKIVMEHLQTAAGVEEIKRYPSNIAATIAPPQLLLNYKDVFDDYGQIIHQKNYCKPIPRYFEDNLALLEAATSGDPKFFFGSDSAPHLIEAKEGDRPAPGISSSIIAVSKMAESFVNAKAQDKLEGFMSIFGPQFYNQKLPEKKIMLTEKEWVVPKKIFGIVPMFAGRKISWSVVAY